MKIALIGYGKMGRMIEQIACQRGHQIVSIIDVNNPQDFDSESFLSADVAIEFTTPQSAYQNCLKAFERNIKVVSGTTGWLEKHQDEIKSLCQTNGKTLFWSSNFSVGVALFRAVNRYLAQIMNGFDQYAVQLTETHHCHKLDAPSGTAVTIAQDTVKELDRINQWQPGKLYHPDGIVSGTEHDTHTLDVHSIRRDEVPGIHTIAYQSQADTIHITHDAHNRSGFALGSVLAAEYALNHQGMLGIEDLFDFLKNT